MVLFLWFFFLLLSICHSFFLHQLYHMWQTLTTSTIHHQPIENAKHQPMFVILDLKCENVECPQKLVLRKKRRRRKRRRRWWSWLRALIIIIIMFGSPFFCTICIKLFETCYALLLLPAGAAAAANATLQSRSLAHLRTIWCAANISFYVILLKEIAFTYIQFFSLPFLCSADCLIDNGNSKLSLLHQWAEKQNRASSYFSIESTLKMVCCNFILV